MSVLPRREGFHSVTPYLFAQGAGRAIDWMAEGLGADIVAREMRPDGTLMHAEVRIGDSMVMVGEATPDFGPMPSSIYLYVEDCDAVYERALAAGGVSVFGVMDLPSGERYGGVKDPCGNLWWIATHVADYTPEEQERRWQEFSAQQSEG